VTDAPALDLPKGFTLTEFEEIGSTNDEAKRLAEQGAAHGTIITAKRQTAGRGRRGRVWVSPEGNLHLSAIMRPAAGIETAAQLSFVAALAVGETMWSFLAEGVTLRYKWPNDVLLNGAKASGLLLETASVAEGSVGWVVIGVGINVAYYPEDVPYPATSLAAQGARGATVTEVTRRFVARLAGWYDRWQEAGFGPVREAWLAKAAGLGKEIEVRLSNETIAGRFERLDSDGALILTLPGGASRRITSGDVFFV
jgi:BirA family transcriptional regulator, biotin operon repressor / biotin---[acetyl-CoA-carboxylase] ligase